jgi:hypothetical protein
MREAQCRVLQYHALLVTNRAARPEAQAVAGSETVRVGRSLPGGPERRSVGSVARSQSVASSAFADVGLEPYEVAPSIRAWQTPLERSGTATLADDPRRAGG